MIPSDIPKFEGKHGHDPANHIMEFHLWCSSNSIVADSERLHLLQRTLTGATTKWSVNISQASHTSFETIATSFITYFQLLIIHDLGLEMLTEFRQNTVTHIKYHTHEWNCHCTLRKIDIQSPFLLYWFLRLLQPAIAKGVATSMPQTKEEAILKSQHFDLIHAQ